MATKAKDVMSTNPEFIPPSTTLHQAAEFMKSHDCGFVPVGENDRLVGACTDRDIAIRAVAEGKDPEKTTVKDVMSKGIHYCFEDDDVEDVAKLMEKFQIRRVAVMNKDKRLVGIIALGDIATKYKSENLCAEILEEVSEKH